LVGQTARSSSCRRLGDNPALSKIKEVLDGPIKSMLSEILGHERRHKYLSDHGFKSHPKHPLVLILSSQKGTKNTLVTGPSLASAKGSFPWVLFCPLAELTAFAAF